MERIKNILVSTLVNKDLSGLLQKQAQGGKSRTYPG